MTQHIFAYFVGGRSDHYFKLNTPCVTYAVAKLGTKAIFTGKNSTVVICKLHGKKRNSKNFQEHDTDWIHSLYLHFRSL